MWKQRKSPKTTQEEPQTSFGPKMRTEGMIDASDWVGAIMRPLLYNLSLFLEALVDFLVVWGVVGWIRLLSASIKSRMGNFPLSPRVLVLFCAILLFLFLFGYSLLLTSTPQCGKNWGLLCYMCSLKIQVKNYRRRIFPASSKGLMARYFSR